MTKTTLLTALLGSVLTASVGCTSGPEQLGEHVINKFTRHIPALDEDVVFVVGRAGAGTYKYVLRQDGRRQAPGEVRAAAETAHYVRFGAMDFDLYRRFHDLAPDDRLPVMLWFEQPAVWESQLVNA